MNIFKHLMLTSALVSLSSLCSASTSGGGGGPVEKKSELGAKKHP